MGQNHSSLRGPPKKHLVFPGNVAGLETKVIGRHNLNLLATGQLHDVGVVATKVSNLQNFAREYIRKLAFWLWPYSLSATL